MTSFQHTVEIDRPVEEVWAFVGEAGNNPAWQGPIVEVRSGAGRPMEVGARIEQVAQFLGQRFEITLEVTQIESLRRSAVRTTSGPLSVRGTYHFEAAGRRTRFTTAGSVDAPGCFRLAGPVFLRVARSEWVSSCETLRQLLEVRARRRP